MPPKVTPTCVDCKTTESLLWRTVENGQICLTCSELREEKEATDENKNVDSTSAEQDKNKKPNKDVKEEKKEAATTSTIEDKCSRLRKSTRATRFKAKLISTNSNSTNGNGEKSNAGGSNSKTQIKGRNRRSLFKRVPFKTPQAQATTHSVESVFHKVSHDKCG